MKEKFLQLRKKIEYFAIKPAFVFIVCLVAFVFHALAWDLAGIVLFAVIGGLAFIVFSDPRPALTVAFTTVFIVSTQNSPGYGDWANYYNQLKILAAIIAAAAFLVLCAIIRCIIKRKNLLSAKSLIPVAVMSVTMLLSGIGDPSANRYTESLTYAACGAAGYIALYVLFSGVTDSVEGLFDYMATLFSGICILIAAEIFYVYILNSFPPYDFLPENWRHCMRYGVFTPGWKGLLIFGWGVSNIGGEMTVMLLPFVFYKLLKTRKVVFYELIALFSMLAGILTLSRNAILFGGILFVGFMIYSFIKTDKRLVFGITLAAFVLAVTVIGVILALNSSFFEIFSRFIDLICGKRGISTGRGALWKLAADYFRRYPIFGGGYAKAFYDEAIAFEHAKGGNFYQTLFHNFLFQTAGSSGIVGLCGLGYFAYGGVKAFVSSRYDGKIYTLSFVVVFAAMACFDIIYFVPYSTAFLMFALVVTEKTINLQSEAEVLRQ